MLELGESFLMTGVNSRKILPPDNFSVSNPLAMEVLLCRYLITPLIIKTVVPENQEDIDQLKREHPDAEWYIYGNSVISQEVARRINIKLGKKTRPD